jgi:hypothetical protein
MPRRNARVDAVCFRRTPCVHPLEAPPFHEERWAWRRRRGRSVTRRDPQLAIDVRAEPRDRQPRFDLSAWSERHVDDGRVDLGLTTRSGGDDDPLLLRRAGDQRSGGRGQLRNGPGVEGEVRRSIRKRHGVRRAGRERARRAEDPDPVNAFAAEVHPRQRDRSEVVSGPNERGRVRGDGLSVGRREPRAWTRRCTRPRRVRRIARRLRRRLQSTHASCAVHRGAVRAVEIPLHIPLDEHASNDIIMSATRHERMPTTQ